MSAETPRRLPGAWLETIARAVFDEPALSHAALPTIADLQQEWGEARTNRGRWFARGRGYVAFWSLVLMAPVVFRTTGVPGRPPMSRAWRVVLLLGFLMTGALLHPGAREWLYDVSGGAWRTVGLVTPVAFLAGPMALLLLLFRRPAGAQDRSVYIPALMLLSLLSITVAGLAGAASVLGLFHGIAQTGSGGAGVLIPVVSDASLAMRNGLLMAPGCLVVAAALGRWIWWSDGQSVPAASKMSGRLALGWSILLAVVLAGIDQLLRAHHDVMQMLTLLADPDSIRQSGLTVHHVADTLGNGTFLVLALGVLLTTVVIVAGVTGWRSLRTQRPHRLFTWGGRAALVIAVAGVAHHSRVVVADLASFHATIDRLIEYQRANPPRRTN